MARTAGTETEDQEKRERLFALLGQAGVGYKKNVEGNVVSVLREIEAQGFKPADYKLLNENRLRAIFPTCNFRDYAAMEEMCRIAASPFASPSDDKPDLSIVRPPDSAAPASCIRPVVLQAEPEGDQSPPPFMPVDTCSSGISDQAKGSSQVDKGDQQGGKTKKGGSREKTQFVAPPGSAMKPSPNSGSILLKETRSLVDMFAERGPDKAELKQIKKMELINYVSQMNAAHNVKEMERLQSEFTEAMLSAGWVPAPSTNLLIGGRLGDMRQGKGAAEGLPPSIAHRLTDMPPRWQVEFLRLQEKGKRLDENTARKRLLSSLQTHVKLQAASQAATYSKV